MEGNMLDSTRTPMVSSDQATDILASLYDLAPAEIHPLPSFDDQNFYISSNNGDEYVLKITNTEDSKNLPLMEIQTYTMSYLHQNGIPTQQIISTKTGQLWSLQELDCGFGHQQYLVRLITYLPGITISKVPLSSKLLYEAGKMAARVDKILQKMEHANIDVLDRDTALNNLSNVPLLEKYLYLLDGEPLQEVVKSGIELFKSCVVPKYPYFRKCVNHGDFNELNFLVQPDCDSNTISGVLDFGDMNRGFYVHELAVTIMHMMTVHPNPIEVGGAMLAGFESELPLNEAERDCLYALVLARFCQVVCCVRLTCLIQPENEYLASWPDKVDPVLLEFSKLSKVYVERTWFQGAEFNSKLYQNCLC